MTKSELARGVSKCIRKYIADLEANSDVSFWSPLSHRFADAEQLFPFNDEVDEKWRLGQGRMKFEHMTITNLDHVSFRSWSPVIYVE